MNLVARLKNLFNGEPAPPDDPDALLRMGYLHKNAARWARRYRKNSPYPHIVIDDFIGPAALARVLAELPQDDQPMQRRARTAHLPDGRPAQLNKRSYSDKEVSPAIRDLLWQMNSQPFLGWVEQVTGIAGLLPDPTFRGGGVHVTDRGGLLRVHADFNKHPDYLWDRRVNLLLYLNEDWQESYGGALELWDEKMSRCEKKVLPVGGRCVIFSTTSTSFHGHPQPLTCPEHMSRKSIALYYYTEGRPASEHSEKHATLWPPLPGEEPGER